MKIQTITPQKVLRWLMKEDQNTIYSYYNLPDCFFSLFAKATLKGKLIRCHADGNISSEGKSLLAKVPFHDEFWQGKNRVSFNLNDREITWRDAVIRLNEILYT